MFETFSIAMGFIIGLVVSVILLLYLGCCIEHFTDVYNMYKCRHTLEILTVVYVILAPVILGYLMSLTGT